ncbi:MAG: bifunctional UDP-3-O-[3-hydroxymyristoyl] N-acetylglucosamine deacetylase/3-hydroxyacyl-ACP dehydratase [Candidatus Omnitrophica bacterium]|nr:bifunctional UDP-3-O-[3-hydroxymyristoyl] N-acetylglucosamine deacetylase/3-hydroxyacyl-ACP dehydratase [Candidatus Omnitrophota bacterium]HOX53916.1 bifunctional UDP-3-O-[3-hydroxymyristoyl] N-acetylglucosamine deacetylase/3-hydroxyacyl-ACP dehydratase [Candidatus Omnitrophota bacterium]
MENQKTIKKDIHIEGSGLHTGNYAKVTFKPAEANKGIVFVRTDLDRNLAIKADAENILESTHNPRRTSIGTDSVQIHTVEHLMAALSGLGIDNLIVEIDNNEVPALDGSGYAFIEMFKKAGLETQDAARKYFIVKEPIWVEEKESTLAVLPYPAFRISYTLDYDHPLLRTQHLSLEITPETFEQEVASYRTFVLEKEVEELKKIGLGKGASFENTLVVTEKGVVDNILRKEDEFVRHKVLDLVGDLYLLGCPIKGYVIALKSGHSLNVKLLHKIYEQMKRYDAAGVKSEYVVGLKEFNVGEIMKVLPHRYPFLLVDRILYLEEGKRAIGIKNVTINENFFVGHFPTQPVMPGVLIIEAMAQVGGVLMLSQAKNLGKIAYFIAANNIKFRKPVVPGDQLVLEVEVLKVRSRTGQVRTCAKVDDKIVAEAELMFSLAET